MLITNCLSSQRIKIVINPGWEKFKASFHVNVPVWLANSISNICQEHNKKKVVNPTLMVKTGCEKTHP